MASFLQRFRVALARGARKADAVAPPQATLEQQDPVLAVATRLRQAREARGLNLRQLAMETRISTTVLEALERGWPDRLPETAYLRTMLPLLERHLGLEQGSLRVVLPGVNLSEQRAPTSTRPPLVSIEVFTSWQGTALYGALLLALVYGINLEQRRLAAAGFHALNPVPPMPESVQRAMPKPGSDLLLAAYPELRPLHLARQDRALALLRRAQPGAEVNAQSGILELNLTRASQLGLQGSGGQRSALRAGPGELVLPLTAPWQLNLDPPPQSAQEVRWNGLPLVPEAPGRYRWPRPAAAASSP